jgi:hypothetical protein
VSDAFFLPDGDRFVATEHTRGPWSREHQHGGPPAALMARVVEAAAEGLTLTRLSVDFLRPVPIAPLTVRTETLRAGRRVRRVLVHLAAGADAVAHGVALLVHPVKVETPEVDAGEPLPLPDAAEPFEIPFFRDLVHYGAAMEVRIARGRFGSGRVAAWMRQRPPLLPGEPPSPMQRVLAAADSGSGVGAALDPRRVTFLNADLAVHVHRPLEGDWVGLDAVTVPDPIGFGLTETRLHDTRGPIGRALQSLVLEGRGGPDRS